MGAQGVLSAGWLVYAKAAKNGTVVESELLFYKVTYPTYLAVFGAYGSVSPVKLSTDRKWEISGVKKKPKTFDSASLPATEGWRPEIA